MCIVNLGIMCLELFIASLLDIIGGRRNHFKGGSGVGIKSAFGNNDFFNGTIRWISTRGLNLHQHIHPFHDFSKDRMTAIKPWSFDSSDKELRTISVGSCKLDCSIEKGTLTYPNWPWKEIQVRCV